MALKLSNRSNIQGFRALENLRIVNELQSNGADIIRLEAGQPCFGAPQSVLDAAKQNIDDNPIQGYTDAIGTVMLRNRLAQYYQDTYNQTVSPDHFCLTTGSSCGFILAFITAFNAGDTVALTTPTYPAYRNILKSLDINVIELPARAEDNYQPTAELLEEHSKTHAFDGLIINSPSNPTGTMMDETQLKNICEWCDQKDIRLISDEAYHGITYETPAQTALAYSKTVIVLNTFSKYFATTGWRMGWLIAPPDMNTRIKSLSENLYVSPPTISQHVALKVLDETKELDKYVEHYKANRNILKSELPKAGLTKLSPMQGAFYTYVDLREHTNDSENFCKRMLHEAGVSATSGLDFDPVRGHQTMRISYAGTPEHMHEACARIKKWINT